MPYQNQEEGLEIGQDQFPVDGNPVGEEEPVRIPVEEAVGVPVEEPPVGIPVEEPLVGIPVEVESPVGNPVEETVGVPVEDPIGLPIEEEPPVAFEAAPVQQRLPVAVILRKLLKASPFVFHPSDPLLNFLTQPPVSALVKIVPVGDPFLDDGNMTFY